MPSPHRARPRPVQRSSRRGPAAPPTVALAEAPATTGTTGRRRPVLPALVAAAVVALVVAIVLLALQDDPQDNLAVPGDETSAPPSSSPDQPSPTTPEPSTPSEPPAPTDADIERFIDVLRRHREQRPRTGLRAPHPCLPVGSSPDYAGFWGRVSNPEILVDRCRRTALTVTYTYRYRLEDLGVRVEDVRLRLEATDEGLLIAGHGLMDLQRLYRDIVESSPDGIWVIDLDGRTIVRQRGHRPHVRHRAARPRRLHVHDTLDELGRAQFDEHLERVRAGDSNDDDVEVCFLDVHGVGALGLAAREPAARRRRPGHRRSCNRVYPYDHRRRVLDELQRRP